MADAVLVLGSFTLALTLTAVIRAAAQRIALMDAPRQDRWHRRPVPRLGGIALYLGFVLPLLVVRGTLNPIQWRALLLGGTAIFIVGVVDDFVRLQSRPKLVLLVLAALVPVVAGVRFALLPPLVGVPLAVAWILGVTNAFNWLDNMDGVAAGVAVIAAAALVAFTWLRGGDLFLPAALLGAAALGFLPHNLPPARIFMGDGGAGFLGLILATLAIIGSYQSVSHVLLTVLVPALILAIPLFDTILVTSLRVLHRRSIFQGGRDHPAHRLVAMGLSERRAMVLLYALSAVAGVASLATASLTVLAGMTVSVVLILAFVPLGLVLAEVRVYDPAAPSEGRTVLRGAFRHKRWIAVMLADIVLVAVAYLAAHLLRYEGRLPPHVAGLVADTLPLILGTKLIGLWLTGTYRGTWRYIGMLDFVRLVRGVTIGSLLGVGALFLWTRLAGVSRAALILDWILALLLLGGSRLSLRLVREYLAGQATTGRRVLIFGAGAGGSLLVRELRQNGALGLAPIGFVDDEPAKRGAIIHGLSVMGTRRDIPALVQRHQVEEVIIAAPSCPPEIVAEIAWLCTQAGVTMRRVRFVLE